MLHVIIPQEDLERINFERFRCQDPIVARHLHALFTEPEFDREGLKIRQEKMPQLHVL